MYYSISHEFLFYMCMIWSSRYQGNLIFYAEKCVLLCSAFPFLVSFVTRVVVPSSSLFFLHYARVYCSVVNSAIVVFVRLVCSSSLQFYYSELSDFFGIHFSLVPLSDFFAWVWLYFWLCFPGAAFNLRNIKSQIRALNIRTVSVRQRRQTHVIGRQTWVNECMIQRQPEERDKKGTDNFLPQEKPSQRSEILHSAEFRLW